MPGIMENYFFFSQMYNFSTDIFKVFHWKYVKLIENSLTPVSPGYFSCVYIGSNIIKLKMMSHVYTNYSSTFHSY